MPSMKSPAEIKSEHPNWTEEQVFNAFDESLKEKVQCIRRDIIGIKETLDKDTTLKDDAWAQCYSEFLRRANALLNPDFGNPADFDDDSPTTPEQEEVMEAILAKRLNKQ